MIIVKIKAGLGNQMFQYAFGRSLSLSKNQDLYLDTESYKNQPEREAKRNFLLENFKIKAKKADEELLKKHTGYIKKTYRKLINKFVTKDAYKFYPFLKNINEEYFEGYWINEKYFLEYEKNIREELQLKTPLGKEAATKQELIQKSKTANRIPICLHIRRGDFVSNPYAAFNSVLTLKYYKEALETISTKLKKDNFDIFIFSDDITWAQENINFEYSCFFVSNEKIQDYEELHLMTLCDHYIIANSTFSWWGAWLNTSKTKLVIAPHQWLKEKTSTELDILPKDWIAI